MDRVSEPEPFLLETEERQKFRSVSRFLSNKSWKQPPNLFNYAFRQECLIFHFWNKDEKKKKEFGKKKVEVFFSFFFCQLDSKSLFWIFQTFQLNNQRTVLIEHHNHKFSYEYFFPIIFFMMMLVVSLNHSFWREFKNVTSCWNT